MPRIAKKQRAGALVIAAAAAAFALMAALQFRWTGQLSEAQRASMGTALTNSVRQFEREFYRELAYLLSVFRPDPLVAADGEWEHYLERYDEWYRSSDYAPLVSRVLLYLTPDGGATDLEAFARRPPGAPLAMLVGNEGDGVSRPALELCDERVRIDVEPAVDSLNVATAAAIALQRLRAVAPIPAPRVGAADRRRAMIVGG